MAYARRTPNGQYRGVAKSGRVTLATKTFRLKRDAVDWAHRVEKQAEGGVDVKAGKARLKTLLPQWLEYREATVSSKTFTADKRMVELVSNSLAARSVSSIKSYDIEKWLVSLRAVHGLRDSSITRYRASMSSFFAWAVKDARREDNPVTKAASPTVVDEENDMFPMTEEQLASAVRAIAEHSPHLARVVYVLGWTGLRWGEARSLRVGDIQTGDDPAFLVSRSQSEGHKVKTTKGRKVRRVPLPDHVADVVEVLASGKRDADLLLTGINGGQLWRHRFVESIGWAKVSGGRRIHDLRHTAACLWLSRGVDLATVSAWMGHASVSTTNRYLHHLGTSADRSGVRLLSAGGARGVRDSDPDLPESLVELGGIEPPTFSLRMVHNMALAA